MREKQTSGKAVYIFLVNKLWRLSVVMSFSCNIILTRCLTLDEADQIRGQKKRREENQPKTRHFLFMLLFESIAAE